MTAVNAIGLLDTSPFRDADQIPLLEDLPVEVWAQEQPEDSGEEEGVDGLGMMELSQHINSHVLVIDEDNLTTTTPTETWGTPQPSQGSAFLDASEVPLTAPTMP